MTIELEHAKCHRCGWAISRLARQGALWLTTMDGKGCGARRSKKHQPERRKQPRQQAA